MDVLRLHGAGDVRLHSEPIPEPTAAEELVRVTAVGLCGSDLHWYQDGNIGDARITGPLVLGHEMGGVVTTGAMQGMRVAIDPAQPCGRCAHCRAGHTNLCPEVLFCGHGATDGGLRTFMAWPRRLLIPVPASIGDDDVALLEPLGIGLHALELGHVRAGMSAGVFGCGPIGLLLIRALRAAGLGPILATDVLPHRVEAARASGADEVQLVKAGGQPDAVDEWGPVNVAFEVAGEDAALETAVRTVRIGGRVVVVGIPPSGTHTLDASRVRRKGLSVILSRRMKAHHFVRAIELVDGGSLDLSGIVTSRYSLSDGPAAFAALQDRAGLKVVIAPSE